MRIPRFTIRRLMAVVGAAGVLSVLLAKPDGLYGISGPLSPTSLAKIVAIASFVALVTRLIIRPVFALLLGRVAGAFAAGPWAGPQGVLIGLASSSLVVLLTSGWRDAGVARLQQSHLNSDLPPPT